METVMHRPWKISVQAKAKNFDLKLTASKILPSWEFLETRFSVLIKIHGFLLRFRSETGGDTSVASQTRRKRKSLISKIFKLLDRLFRTTTLKHISRFNKVDDDDDVEKRGRGGRFNFKSEFLTLLDKFHVKRGVRNRSARAAPPPNNIPNLWYSENGFPDIPRRREIRYKEELMMIMGSLLVGYLLVSPSPLVVLLMNKDPTVLGINTILLTLLVLIYAIVVLTMKKSNFTWKRNNPRSF